MTRVSELTRVQFAPSLERYACNKSPVRTSRTHTGGAPPLYLRLVVLPEVWTRRPNQPPFPAEVPIIMCRDAPLSVSRTITPAFAHGSLLPTEATRATMSTLPVTC